MRRPSFFEVLVAVALTTVVSCRRGNESDERSSIGAAAASFFDSQLVGGERRSDTEGAVGIESCEPDGLVSPVLWLAWYRVIETDVAGDTAVATVEFVSVAQEDNSNGRREVSALLERSVGHWILRRRPGARAWGVCAVSSEGFDVRRHRGEAVRIPPDSAADLEVRADSVRRDPPGP